jgi:hypothetical protein
MDIWTQICCVPVCPVFYPVSVLKGMTVNTALAVDIKENAVNIVHIQDFYV